MLDIEQPEALTEYLLQAGHIRQRQEVLHFERLAGGVSSRTVLVRLQSGVAWVLKQALPKLRVSVDWFSDPVRVHREALGLRVLQQMLPHGSVPEFVFEDETAHILCMTAVPSPHVNWKTPLLAGQVDLKFVEQFGQLLGTMHTEARLRARELQPLFADRTFFESLRIEPYYEYTATQVPQAAPFLRALIADTRQRCTTLVHGDYSPKNVLVHDSRLVLLDHEVIHWGDPAFDLGFALTHFLSKAHHLPEHRAEFLQAVLCFVQAYQERCGVALESDALEEYGMRHMLGCLLARVAGRSTLEYLSAEERARQRAIILRLMSQPPATLAAHIAEFGQSLG